jgi:hypothetical protein
MGYEIDGGSIQIERISSKPRKGVHEVVLELEPLGFALSSSLQLALDCVLANVVLPFAPALVV